jgi:AraC-like DNA-binding protein
MTILKTVDTPARGVINPAQAQKMFRLERYLPEPDLEPFIEHFWLVEWTLPDGMSHVQRTLPSPCVHVVFDRGRSGVFGVMVEAAFEYTLSGHGRILGVRFRPGGFRGFIDTPQHAITDRIMPLAPLFGGDAAQLEQRVLDAPDDAGMVAAAAAIIRRALPALNPQIARIEAMLTLLLDQHGITRVAQWAKSAGLSVRNMQLLFRDQVGASPKWVIRRHRLLEAADRLGHGGTVDLAQLALALGYCDQSHFTGDFERLVGKPPAHYQRSCAVAKKQHEGQV